MWKVEEIDGYFGNKHAAEKARREAFSGLPLNLFPITKVASLSRTQVLKRDGWTPTLIKRFLGEPDAIGKSKGYFNDSHLYLVSRIEAVEASDEWQKSKQQPEERERRQAAAQKARRTIEAREEEERRAREEEIAQMYAEAREEYRMWRDSDCF